VAGSDEGILKPEKKPKAFNFGGLRCHLKEKYGIVFPRHNSQLTRFPRHKVVEVADEDFFVFDEYLREWAEEE
jgi:hypothetical protein